VTDRSLHQALDIEARSAGRRRRSNWTEGTEDQEVGSPQPGINVPSPVIKGSTPHGPARVIDRHSCAFGTRRFGHVILEYRQHVVSLLVTADDEGAGGVALPPDLDPHLHGGPVNGLSVASIRGAHHAILLVSDLDGRELTQLSTTVSVPLVDQLVSGLLPPAPTAVAAFDPNIAIERFIRRGL